MAKEHKPHESKPTPPPKPPVDKPVRNEGLSRGKYAEVHDTVPPPSKPPKEK
jgi:hypothetical protein